MKRGHGHRMNETTVSHRNCASPTESLAPLTNFKSARTIGLLPARFLPILTGLRLRAPALSGSRGAWRVPNVRRMLQSLDRPRFSRGVFTFRVLVQPMTR